MRIGILTLPLHVNYGGILQAWALQSILESRGHEVDIFSIKPSKSHKAIEMPIVWTARMFRKILGKESVPIFLEYHAAKKDRKLYSKIYKFVRNKVNLKFVKALDRLPTDDYDLILVGSDQIWRKIYVKYLWQDENVSHAFLSSFDNVKKIAYAASFGTDSWDYSAEELQSVGKALKSYKAISVREKSSVGLMEDLLGVIPELVLDPTLLISAIEYKSKLGIAETEDENIVSYILDKNSETESLIDKAVKSLGCDNVELNAPAKDGAFPSIEEWVSKIASARLVVTDSFHGCVFSIIFNKPLIFIKNGERGSARFDSLMETFGLENNMVNGLQDYDPEKCYELPDKVRNIKDELRKQSMDFLVSALN